MTATDTSLRKSLTSAGMRWHRPLIALSGAMLVLALAMIVTAFVDGRTVTGLNVWFKPIKFALSIAIYGVTLAWLIGQLDRSRRLASIAGTVSAIGLALEMVVIVGIASVGETSHFNVSTPLHTAAWSVMAMSIVVVWIMTLVVSIALFRNRLGDAARTIAIRAGALISIVGMGLGFLMTGPTAAQLDSFQGVAGAHTVGLADGGPGLPILGWSTIAGDLRIPHFVGMHALQAIPILVIALELASRRWPTVLTALVRVRLTWIAVATYAATLATVTAQAIAGQPVVRPEGAILVTGTLIAVAAATAAVAVIAGRFSFARDRRE